MLAHPFQPPMQHPSPLSPATRFALLLTLGLAALFGLPSCSALSERLVMNQVEVLAYDDFGPEALAAPLLGPRAEGAQVVVHYRLSEKALAARYPGAQYRAVPVVPALRHLNAAVARTPDDAAHAEARARMIATRARLLNFYNTWRATFNALTPATAGRGYMARQMVLPAIGTTR